ncbi:hypothetical protein E5161_03065 [Cohnella pontilimi]|uniref:Uncharacterized protein n=1 Tax=Cohnella pontilimi TaxID=2564100 RepID=A0A4U0FH82_9BACL|nr:hypothetical protein [Cohnella pontilimi]TJY44376.1 hypothetical protein E5161_03065 [Cohnella pontilimi]
MEKRLNRTDLGFSLAFLLMLVIAIGAFFYGVKVGTERAAAKQQEQNAAKDTTAKPAPNAYQQQDLVSFYHTVFLPYREFQSDFFKAQSKWSGDPSADLSASLKELAKTADAKYETISTAYVPVSSPLLKDAQNDYLKSLKLFSESFASQASGANKADAAKLMKNLQANAFYTDGLRYALSGQNAYYRSMLKWGATVNTEFPDDFKSPASLDLSRWKTLSLLVKNKVIADYLSENALFTEFLPQDLTARIDEFIRSGQAAKMKQTSLRSIAELLTGTDAVRSGDFLDSKTKLYGREQLPQLPFFVPDK